MVRLEATEQVFDDYGHTVMPGQSYLLGQPIWKTLIPITKVVLQTDRKDCNILQIKFSKMWIVYIYE